MTPVAYAEPRAIRAGIARGNRKLNVEGRMSEFKAGDKIICPVGVKVTSRNRAGVKFNPEMEHLIGQVMEVESINYDGTVSALGWTWADEWIELAEDRSTWHPHHDVIVAWAKGARIRGREKGSQESWHEWNPSDPYDVAPSWELNWEYEVIPEPDHTAEIAEIERKMRELSESQKELADRLDKLKQ